jgi:endogenous inhibitor of DNA gyrase (YacG/DUF329 family)
VQRDVSATSGDRTPRPCPRCGAPLRLSHRQYAGAGSSTVVLRCAACGDTVRSAPRPDAGRIAGSSGRSRRHQPVDEGPPANPVIDPELARRLLEELRD